MSESFWVGCAEGAPPPADWGGFPDIVLTDGDLCQIGLSRLSRRSSGRQDLLSVQHLRAHHTLKTSPELQTELKLGV